MMAGNDIEGVGGTFLTHRAFEPLRDLVTSASKVLLYDGRAMISEVGRGVPAAPSYTNTFVYGVDLSGTFQGAGTIGGILLANFAGTNAVFAFDANGNVTDLVATNGTLAAHYEFDPYGNVIASSGDLAAANPYRFSSKYTDDETGLVYYGFRSYWPELGRWGSRDPLDHLKASCVAVVGNNPVDRFDLLGLRISTVRDPGKTYVDQDWSNYNTWVEASIREIVRVAFAGLPANVIEAEVQRRLGESLDYAAFVELLSAISHIKDKHSPPKVSVTTFYVSKTALPTIIETISDGMVLQDKSCEHGVYVGHGWPPSPAPIDPRATMAITMWDGLILNPENVFRHSRFAFHACRGQLYNRQYHRIGYGYSLLGSDTEVGNTELARSFSGWLPRFDGMLDKMLDNNYGCCDQVKINLYIGEEPNPGSWLR